MTWLRLTSNCAGADSATMASAGMAPGAGAVDDVLEALDVFVEVVDGGHLHRLRTLAGDRRARRLRPAVHVLLVDQVELQLEGGDDGQFHLGEPGHHLAQDFAGSAKNGSPSSSCMVISSCAVGRFCQGSMERVPGSRRSGRRRPMSRPRPVLSTVEPVISRANRKREG